MNLEMSMAFTVFATVCFCCYWYCYCCYYTYTHTYIQIYPFPITTNTWLEFLYVCKSLWLWILKLEPNGEENGSVTMNLFDSESDWNLSFWWNSVYVCCMHDKTLEEMPSYSLSFFILRVKTVQNDAINIPIKEWYCYISYFLLIAWACALK